MASHVATLILHNKIVCMIFHCFLIMFVDAVNQIVAFNKFYVSTQNKLQHTQVYFSFSALTSNRVAIINNTKQTLF